MYPSDYGYATSGGATTDGATCLNTSLNSWDGSGVSDCKNNDWLYINGKNQYTLMSNSNNSFSVFYVSSSGYVSEALPYYGHVVHPSVYLESNIGLESGGTGSSASPFVLKK